MYVEDTTSKEQKLREIILWASEVKQKSINLQTKYALEFTEELDKNIPRTCEAIAYSIYYHKAKELLMKADSDDMDLDEIRFEIDRLQQEFYDVTEKHLNPDEYKIEGEDAVDR